MTNFKDLKYELIKKVGNMRRGRVTLARGSIETPVFMPVGTAATVKSMTPDQVAAIGFEIILANTFHLHLRPGSEVIRDLGGLHQFMNWKKPVLTDSGGFQVFSLQDLRKIDEEGVRFQSPLDGSMINMTPESSVQIQQNLGSDIIMAFDECIPFPCEFDDAKKSSERTIRWLERCKNQWESGDSGVLFGIVQGGMHPELRKWSTRETIQFDLPGYAIGGLSVGESKDLMYPMLEASIEELPEDKPRYLMGVGTAEDFIRAIEMGVDMFDCVVPTREARTGRAHTWEGILNIRNAANQTDSRPLSESCRCYTCQNYSRAYLRHLHLSKEILGAHLMTLHNLYFFHELLSNCRQALENGTWDDLKAKVFSAYIKNEN